MAANSHRVGSSYGGAASYRSRDGLSTRPVGASEEIQLRIDPMDLDEEITGLHRQVRRNSFRPDRSESGSGLNWTGLDAFEEMEFDMIHWFTGKSSGLLLLLVDS
ncbi:Bet1-like protein [Vigna angularis]|uniref:Bet1-like protein n=1 Tax=Phaseolus angularis TaxID=3914 RepID=A0A8T0JYY6_PHAAN|nr:Bet1-like protein [Vigna angularis]